MKRLIFLVLSFFLLLQSCDGSDDSTPEEPQLVINAENLSGEWLAIERSEVSDPSGPTPFRPLEESQQYKIIFRQDLTVAISFLPCDGTYVLDNDDPEFINSTQLIYDFECIGPDDPTRFIRSLTKNELLITTIVDENSSDKFRRLITP